MYIRQVKTKSRKTGREYVTLKLVENKRIDGNPKQINLLSLGRLDEFENLDLKILAKRIEELYYHKHTLLPAAISPELEKLAQFYTSKLLQKEFNNRPAQPSDSTEMPEQEHFEEININTTTTKETKQIGGEFLCNQAIKELGLDQFLQDNLSLSSIQVNHCMLALSARLLFPASENKSAKWLNDNSAAIDFFPLESGMVNKNQLYSAANLLYKHKNLIENYLNDTVESVLDLKRKIILYDLTNSHFEGLMKKSEKLKFGRNKQKRNDCRQVTLGLLTDEFGLPIKSDYYEGNVSEPGTLELILEQLQNSVKNNLFSSEKPCIIMDAGIATDDTIKMLIKKGYDYICVSRSKHKDLLDKVQEEQLMKFQNKSEQELSAQLFTREFSYTDAPEHRSIQERVIYIRSPDKQLKEKSIDAKKCQRFEQGLKAIEKTVNNPRGQRSLAKIHQRLGRLKEKNKGAIQYYDIQLKDDTKNITSISWRRKNIVPKEKKQGVYFLRTNLKENDEEKLWKLYRLINEVEDAFGCLKSELLIRPNFHQTDQTIEAHINLSVLAYYIVSFIRHRLKTKGINYSWNEIKRIMSTQSRTLQVSKTKSGKALWTRTCTVPSAKIEEICQKMGYKKIPYYRKSILR